MDRVRLGRVLGRGTRLAARTAFDALDAATSPNPARPAEAGTAPETAGRVKLERPVPTSAGIRPKASKPHAGMLAPLRRASRAVSLEVTGSFFALFALSFSVGAWHARGNLHAGTDGVARFAVYVAVALFFLYCSVSSFVRARRLS